MNRVGVLVFGFFLAGTLAGCATFSSETFHADGAKASAFCTTGGPGGVLGIGPGGIVAGAKANEDFEGSVSIDRDCSIVIESK